MTGQNTHRRLATAAAFGAALMVVSPEAPRASPTDDLAQCLVRNTTGGERLTMMRWFAIAISSHSSLAGTVAIRPGAVEESSKGMADLFTELLTVRCLEEMRAACAGGCQTAVEAAFGTLAKASMGDLQTDPEVGRVLRGLEQFIDPKKFFPLHQ